MKSSKFWNSRQNSCLDKKTSAVSKSENNFCTLENFQKFWRRLSEDFWNAAHWGFSWKIRPQCGKATTLPIHCAQPKKVRLNKTKLFQDKTQFYQSLWSHHWKCISNVRTINWINLQLCSHSLYSFACTVWDYGSPGGCQSWGQWQRRASSANLWTLHHLQRQNIITIIQRSHFQHFI